MNKFLALIFVLLSKVALADVNVNSIIKLDNNIPEECGLRFFFQHNFMQTEVLVSIKKIKNKETITQFIVNSKESINKADIITTSSKLSEIINKKNFYKKKIFLKGKTDQDLMSFFFQELLIGGGLIIVDKSKYEIKGPIDSKVRLEYLFCTGEMFLPNYKN